MFGSETIQWMNGTIFSHSFFHHFFFAICVRLEWISNKINLAKFGGVIGSFSECLSWKSSNRIEYVRIILLKQDYTSHCAHQKYSVFAEMHHKTHILLIFECMHAMMHLEAVDTLFIFRVRFITIHSCENNTFLMSYLTSVQSNLGIPNS